MTSSIISDKQFRIFFISFWVLWAALHAWLLHQQGVGNNMSITDSLISNTVLAAGCLVVSNNMRYYLPRREKYGYIVVVAVGLSLISVYLSKWILQTAFNDAYYEKLLNITFFLRFCGAFLLITGMSMFSLMWYTQQEQSEMTARQAEVQQLSKEAELFKLRQQLQPHFLFNSLNSISALTGSQPEKARHMIQQLSDFLRGTLKKDDSQWNSLEEELQYLQLYLDIEKVRFGHRLQTEIIRDDETLAMKLPSLLLQPVVENAIKFGLYDTTDDVLIKINVTREKNNMIVTIQNPYDEETSPTVKGTGFGLSSIQRRLFLLFARNDLIQVSGENNLFTTTIIIPQAG